MTALCPTCHQPLPDQPRRDPPLPPLDAPAVVTIHDLPAEERARVEVDGYNHVHHLRLARDADVAVQRLVGDGREAGR